MPTRFPVPEKEANPVCLYHRPNERPAVPSPRGALSLSPPAHLTPLGQGGEGGDERAFGTGAQGPWQR